MKSVWKRGTGLLLALVLALSLTVPAGAAELDLEDAVQGSAAYLSKTVSKPQVGSIGGEWAVLALARSGAELPQAYWDNYYAAVEKYVADCSGVLHEKKYTEYSRVILALTAIGADPTDVAGYNLLTPLGDFDKTVWQGINGPVWALIALDSGEYPMPVNDQAKTQATRQMYLEEILSRQLDNGGWNLTDRGGNGQADPDVTGMVLQALSNYQSQAGVKGAVSRALTYLSQTQEADGGYASHSTSNSESVVQVIVALTSLGIDLEDAHFVKNGNTLLDNLLGYRQADGSFLHTSAGTGESLMSCEQGLYGLVAAQRAAQGKSKLYEMDDVTIHVTGVDAPQTGLPGKNEDVQKCPVILPGATFVDIQGHTNQQAVEALASRGIINGKEGDLFDPSATMTRAEFAAIVVRGLGLTPQADDAFTDVTSQDWFACYVGTAHRYGIIEGVGGGRFNPRGTINRQQAAVMVARAAKLCGMDTSLSSQEIRDVLAQFGDYMTIASWAQEGMAFCYKEGILDQSDWNTEPTRAILRCQVAQMLYEMLDAAKLL